MSIGELAVIFIVAVLIAKPEDLPIAVKYLKKARNYFSDLKKNLFSYIEKEIGEESAEPEKESAEINFYLKKIISLEGKYEGEYSLAEVKSKYENIVKEKIKEISGEK